MQFLLQADNLSGNALAQYKPAVPELPHGLFKKLRADKRRDRKRLEWRHQRRLKRIIGWQPGSVKPKNRRFINFYRHFSHKKTRPLVVSGLVFLLLEETL
jgi:hypothetical protein